MRTAPSTSRSQSLLLIQAPEVLAQSFFEVETARGVAALLDVPYSLLVYHLHKHGAPYAHFTVPKRGGGARDILAPVSALKIIQRKLNQVLSAIYRPRPSVHGFTAGRSILTNAALHTSRRFVLNIDLEDFFGCINFGRVRGLFRARPYVRNDEVATILAQICCHDNRLPQGAPTSPVVSNMVCARLDGELQGLAKRHGVTYSRYADDITLSTTSSRFPHALASVDQDAAGTTPLVVGPELERVIVANGFSINTRKVRLRPRTQRQEVTGLTVNVSPNVQRRYIRQVRAMLHAWRKHGLALAEEEHHAKYSRRHRQPARRPPSFALIVKGKIDFLSMVRGSADPVFRRLLRQYADLTPGFVYPFSEEPTGDLLTKLKRALWVLESYEPALIGTAFAVEGVGLVTCAHVLSSRTEAFQAHDVSRRYEIEVLERDDRLDLAIIALPTLPNAAETSLTPAKEPGQQMAPVIAAGFPNYHLGDTIQVTHGHIAGFRTRSMVRLILLDAPVIQGMSGGPILDVAGEVIGVAKTGADSIDEAHDTEKHGAIPLSAIRDLHERLQAKRSGQVG